MLLNYKNLENINEFQFLQKKENQWYLCKGNEEDGENYTFIEDINSFLSQHPQFSKINESKICLHRPKLGSPQLPCRKQIYKSSS